MLRFDRQWYCRRCAGETSSAPLPFVLPGARPVYAPDRVCDVRHLQLELTLDFERRRVAGVCRQILAPLNDGPTRLELNAVEMEIEAVELVGGGSALPPPRFEYDGRLLSVDLGARLAGEQLELAVRYAATPRRGLYFIGPEPAYPQRPVQVWSQGQDEDNRYWFPCFDHPNAKSTSEMMVTVPEPMVALSNGRLLEEKRSGATRTFHYRHDVPHSSYLITLVAGNYAVLRDRCEEIEVLYFVPPDRQEDAPRSFARTPEMIRLFSERTGQRYPYPRYSQITVAEFIFGGMENTTATTLTDQTLHDARAHLDFSSEPLVAHELAHQWFGDLLTCRDWSEGWLNEGFATFMETVWREHADGSDEADYDRLLDMDAYLEEANQRYRRPIVTNVFHEPIDVFDRHLYEKGGSVLHMLRQELGDARFWKGMRHYVASHRGGSVETRDLVRAVEEATGWNGDRFFQQWIFRAGHPELKAEYSWDEGSRAARLMIEQTQKLDEQTPLFHLPMVVRFRVADRTHDVGITVQEKQERLLVPLPGKPSQVILDPGHRVLKTLEMKKPDELWHAELAEAELAIDRIRAARALGKAASPTAVNPLAAAMEHDPFWAVRGEAAQALGALRIEAARRALAARLALEAHPKARRQVVKALGSFRHDEEAAQALERPLGGDASYFVEAESALALGKTRSPRAFAALGAALNRPSFHDVVRSSALAGLAELRDERGIDLALAAAAYGQPSLARRAAVAALGKLGAEHGLRRSSLRETLVELLDDADFRVRVAAVDALATLGEGEAVAPLERVAGKDLDGRVRRKAREAARALREQTKQDEAVRSLRDAVERLEDRNLGFEERLLKLEARLKAEGKP